MSPREAPTLRAYQVHDYQTGRELSGEATDELIEASHREITGTGAVPAVVTEGGIWALAPEGTDRRAIVVVYVIEGEERHG